MVSNRILILECATDRVSLSELVRRDNRPCLRNYAVELFPGAGGPTGVGPEAWLELCRAALTAVARRLSCRGAVVLVAPAHLFLTKSLKVPRVDAGVLEEVIRFAAGEAIPYALTEVVWDQVRIGESETEIELLLCAAKREELESLCAAAVAVELEPWQVLPASFASLAGFSVIDAASNGPWLGLNIGRTATTLVLVHEGRFAVRTFGLDLGGSLTDQTQSAGSLTSEEELPAGIETRLLAEVTRSMVHFQRQGGLEKPREVRLAGAGAQHRGLVAAIREKFGVASKVVDALATLTFASDSLQCTVLQQAPALHDVIGAAIIQFDPRHAAVNLLPPQFQRRSRFQRRRLWFALAAWVSATVLVPPLVHYRMVRDEAVKKTAAIEKVLAPVRTRAGRLQSDLRRLADQRRALVTLEAAGQRRTTWLSLLAALQDRVGKIGDVWLESLRIAPVVPGSPLKLQISGRMLDRSHPLDRTSAETRVRVNALLASLADLPSIAAVETGRFDNSQAGVLRFDFALLVDPARPL